MDPLPHYCKLQGTLLFVVHNKVGQDVTWREGGFGVGRWTLNEINITHNMRRCRINRTPEPNIMKMPHILYVLFLVYISYYRSHPNMSSSLPFIHLSFYVFPSLLLTSCHTGQSYPDPVVGASRSFIHRISELSTLEGETVRQEKLKKMRKAKKPSS